MSVNGQQFLDNLQAADHNRKRHLVFLSGLFVMIVVVVTWASTNFIFSGSGEEGTALIRHDFSLWQTVKGGSILVTHAAIDTVSSVGGVLRAEKNYMVKPTSENQ